MKTVLVATRNRHKVLEIAAILGGEFRLLTLNDIPELPAVTEDAQTFAGNAQKKAHETAAALRAGSVQDIDWVLADDSGLEVDALGGAPGVRSARFAAEARHVGNSSDGENNSKLLRLLEQVPTENRTARFRCALVIKSVGVAPKEYLFEGVCPGRIDKMPHGQGGFGYDPLFIPDGYEVSFAELGEAVKNRISHRARALAALQANSNLL